jgi:ComF family protein
VDCVQNTCPACLAQPPPLDSCRALFSYQPPIDNWIHALKFGRDLAVAHLLGQMLVEHLPSPEAGTRVLAVPLHARRLRERGYNQATEIARPLIQRGWLPDRCGCYRLRHTPAQSALSASDRHCNLHGAFAVRKRLQGEDILLIDDVMTTGTTLNEVATVLKEAGAGRVDARVITRALRPA